MRRLFVIGAAVMVLGCSKEGPMGPQGPLGRSGHRDRRGLRARSTVRISPARWDQAAP
jgi:hypothetical protein